MQSITKTSVQYDRSARHWLTWQDDYNQALVVGGVTAFPAGQDGKRAALLSALTQDAPVVAAWVDALIIQPHPANGPLIDRALQAGFLVRDNHVSAKVTPDRKVIRAQVESQSRQGVVYTVTRNIIWQCTCPDWRAGREHNRGTSALRGRPHHYAPHVSGIGTCCKHVIAAVLVSKLAFVHCEELLEREEV
jgi:hypothetical protein